MSRLALYTFGVTKDVMGSKTITDFFEMAPSVYAAAGAIDDSSPMPLLPVPT